ncbi:MAG: toxic anion resistance protein [Clostridiaceae bacterium]|nr:toxic anion resistance protein [Clostridiaceae bacterium]
MTDEQMELKQETPALTLDPFAAEQPAEEKKPEITPVQLDESSLTEAERKAVDDFAEKIDIGNSTMILQYGASAQKKLSDFSEAALSSVRTKDLGEVGDMITGLVTELKGFSADEDEKGVRGFFRKSANKIASLKTRYDKAEVNVGKISAALEGHQVQLLKDIAMLDQMYEKNLVNFKEISMYILAGKKKLQRVRETILPALVAKAKETGLPEDSQKANDMAAFCDRFEKKLHDLELTRMISLQMAPQIRLVQNNDTLMAEKIQSTINNTIPLWKSQMVLALGVEHSAQALKAQREVTEMTNELLRKNAEKLKMATIETARESERGIVDIETLQHTNRMLIESLDEVVKIQDEGRAKRRAAEAELGRIEGELKQKLLDIRQ